MKNLVIHNLTNQPIGAGTKTRLPRPFHWLHLPPKTCRSVACGDQDMEQEPTQQCGFKVKDLLRQMEQAGKIRVDIENRATDAVFLDGGGDEMTKKTADDPLYAVPPEMTSEAPTKRIMSSAAIDLPDVSYEPQAEQPQDREIVDRFSAAVKMAFIGAGQGGGRIAQTFADMGYGRVCAVNTTEQDLAALQLPNKLIIGNNRGGAGKDPEEGRLAAKESFEDIMDLLMRSWGEGVEQMFICVGGGGGSGTGSWPILVDAVREFGKSTNIEKPIAKHIGVIVTLPKRSEGARVQKNALTAVQQAVEMTESGKISTLILVDNAKVHELFPGLPVKSFWGAVNQNFCGVFHTFNLLAAQNSAYNTFDRQDFRSILRNGILIFGSTKVEKWNAKEDISHAVRQNLKGSLLADGFDLSKANMAGAVVVAPDDILSKIPMEHVDYALNSLGRALGNEGITLHSGIYESRKPGMRVFTIISGLEGPEVRLKELESLAQ